MKNIKYWKGGINIGKLNTEKQKEAKTNYVKSSIKALTKKSRVYFVGLLVLWMVVMFLLMGSPGLQALTTMILAGFLYIGYELKLGIFLIKEALEDPNIEWIDVLE